MSTRSSYNGTVDYAAGDAADDMRSQRVPRGPQSLPRSTGIAVVAALLLAGHAGAEARWSGSVGVTSDYIQQGLSETRGGAAVQGGVRAQLDEHWTLGAWGSSIERYAASGTGIELDLYAARTWQLGPDWIAALTATHYFYPEETGAVSYDYDEVTASLGYRSLLFATIAWSPDYTDVSYRGRAENRCALSYELSASQPILGSWSGSIGVGYRDLSDLFDESYWYGHAGIMHSGRHFTVHLTYTYVDEAARELFGHERADPAWSGTVIWRFGGLD